MPTADTVDLSQYSHTVLGWPRKGEGAEKYRLVVTKQSQDVKYNIGNTVNSIVMTTYGAR